MRRTRSPAAEKASALGECVSGGAGQASQCGQGAAPNGELAHKSLVPAQTRRPGRRMVQGAGAAAAASVGTAETVEAVVAAAAAAIRADATVL